MSAAADFDRELLALLAERVAARDSGVITAQRGKQRCLFCLQRGALTYAASNIIEEQFGATVTRRKLLPSDAVAQAETMAAARGQRLGALLMAQGTPPEKSLREAMADHVRWLLASALGWSKGECRFERGQPNIDGEPTAELDGVALVLELARGLRLSGSELRLRIGPPDFRPLAVDAQKELLGPAAESPLLGYLLASDGSRDISSLIEGSPAKADETLKALYALRLLGAVAARERDVKPRTDGSVTRAECLGLLDNAANADHYGVLGLTTAATREQVRDAYYYLARRFHPDRFRTGELHDLLPRVEKFFTKVTEAYNTLYDEERRAEYERQQTERVGRPDRAPEADPTYIARQNYLRGKLLVEKGRFQDAVRFLENAVEQDDSAAPYHLELGRVLIRNPRRRADAERHLLAAVERDPTMTDAFRALGQLYERLGRTDEAIARYREVLRWDPNDAESQARLRDLGVKPQEDDGGLLGWLR